jgi:hypothetical protein
MARWKFMDAYRVHRQGTLWMDRLRLVQTPWFGVYLHRIHTTDIDPDPHDHPWWFASRVLAGGYTETVFAEDGTCRVRRHDRGSWHKMPITSAHRITDVRGLLWTLVITGPKVRTWGFWADEGFVPWDRYLATHDEEAALWGN